MTCARCDRPFVTKGPGLRNSGRGLCSTCRERAIREGRLDEYERAKRPADEMLDDWQLMRSEGYTVPQAAERMGVSADALATALNRARHRGDPRAVFTWAGLEAARRARREAS